MFARSHVCFLALFAFANATFIPPYAPRPVPQYGERGLNYGHDAYGGVSVERDLRAISRDPVLQALHNIVGRELRDAPHTEHTRELPLPGGGRDYSSPLWQDWIGGSGFFRKRSSAVSLDPVPPGGSGANHGFLWPYRP